MRARQAGAGSAVSIGGELGLDAAAFLFLPVLALASRGLAPLEAIAGIFALGFVAPRGFGTVRPLLPWAGLFAALVAWGAVSAAWAVEPGRSLVMAARLLGLFAAGFALVAAAPLLSAPKRLVGCFYAGLALALLLLLVQLATGGRLTRPFFQHPFIAPGLNQASDTLAIVLLPACATLFCRGRRWTAALAAAAVLAVIYALVGTAAQVAAAVGIGAALALLAARRTLARLAAIAAVLVVVTTPLTFARLAEVPTLMHDAGSIKISASHRLLIWSFAGTRIAEKPFGGWGLDSSRAIPGGQEWIRPGEQWLPLHPHNAAIQLWLELGVPGATLFTLILGGLWLLVGESRWPPPFAAAAGGSLAAGCAAAFASYGIWQEWWQGTLWFALFLVLVMARSLDAGAGDPLRRRNRAP